ncbi:YitT family protein [Candidatus Tachikawaea gelatinosa]|uniref:YitT family protein n=1 Tax=Candidatus Tachikawaea gelatinosa TaxID=1410383 RepID=A0A090BWH1_9ENTR|nr:YitT family protein [Candidatus Tachikawaea gelatinosa]BAP58596.1 hypothetical protein TGUWTKB_3570 [Candidatus Tachikawaea gelatinosa]
MQNLVKNHYQFSYIEDFLAIFLGAIMISLGITFLKEVGAIIGSMAGIAFIFSKFSSFSFSKIFFIINLPFYILALRFMGIEFILKTFFSVGLVSIFVHFHLFFFRFYIINPFYAIILGNILIAVGLIILFRHKSSLGGINILSLFLQEKIGLRAGAVQIFFDILVLIGSLSVFSFRILFISLLGACIMNLIIFINYQPENKSHYILK